MNTESRYFPRLKRLLTQPSFSAIDAENEGVTRQALSYFVQTGLIERVSRGVYRNPEYESKAPFHLEELALVAYSIPSSIICLISALYIYELTEEIPRENWLAIPHSKRKPRRSHVRIVRMRNTALGLTTIRIGEFKLPIFDKERCIIDAFRYLSLEVAIKALRTYLESRTEKPNLQKLEEYGAQLRVNITPYLQVLLT